MRYDNYFQDFFDMNSPRINGQSVLGWSLAKIQRNVMGVKGSPVRLECARNGRILACTLIRGASMKHLKNDHDKISESFESVDPIRSVAYVPTRPAHSSQSSAFARRVRSEDGGSDLRMGWEVASSELAPVRTDGCYLSTNVANDSCDVGYKDRQIQSPVLALQSSLKTERYLQSIKELSSIKLELEGDSRHFMIIGCAHSLCRFNLIHDDKILMIHSFTISVLFQVRFSIFGVL